MIICTVLSIIPVYKTLDCSALSKRETLELITKKINEYQHAYVQLNEQYEFACSTNNVEDIITFNKQIMQNLRSQLNLLCSYRTPLHKKRIKMIQVELIARMTDDEHTSDMLKHTKIRTIKELCEIHDESIEQLEHLHIIPAQESASDKKNRLLNVLNIFTKIIHVESTLLNIMQHTIFQDAPKSWSERVSIIKSDMLDMLKRKKVKEAELMQLQASDKETEHKHGNQKSSIENHKPLQQLLDTLMHKTLATIKANPYNPQDIERLKLELKDFKAKIYSTK